MIIPVVVGSLGAVSSEAEQHLEKIPGNVSLAMCQKITLVGSKKILSGVLGRQGGHEVDGGV